MPSFRLQFHMSAALWFLCGCNEAHIDPTDVVVFDVAVDTASDTTSQAGLCPVELVFRAGPGTRTVHAAGRWNGFSRTATPLVRASADDPFRGDVWLAPGEYPFKFVVDGTFENAPPADGPTYWDGGVENRNLVVADCFRPAFVVENLDVTPPTNGNGRIRARICVDPAPGGLAIQPDTLNLTLGGQGIAPTWESGERACFTLDEERPAGKHTLRANIADAEGETAELQLPLWVEKRIFDWREALLMMVIVDRFIDSDGVAEPAADVAPIANHLGGDLGGLRERIENGHFEALGVDALWLAPVQRNAAGGWLGLDGVHRYSGYHGYWPIDAHAIDPRLAEVGATSPEAAFDTVIEAAHARGIRVVVDVVLNHVHEDHHYCKDFPEMCKRTCVCGQDGCSWDSAARECQFAPYLPDLDHRDHATLQRVLDDVVSFVKRHDIDGLRIDAVKHVDRAAITNLRARLAAAVDSSRAPFWLVGETFTGGDGRAELMGAIGPGALDGQFDFPLYWAMRDVFVHGAPMDSLDAAVVASETAYGAAMPWMSPFVGNHDVERLATALAKNDLGPFGGTIDLLDTEGDTPSRWDLINPISMALAFVMTLPGIPLVYAGDEVGLAGSGDPDNRRMYPTQLSADRAEIQRRVAEIGQLRRQQTALRRGARREIWKDGETLVQLRWLNDAPAGEFPGVIIAMNRGEGRTITVQIPAETLGTAPTEARHLVSGETWTVTDGTLTLQLDPWEYALIGVR